MAVACGVTAALAALPLALGACGDDDSATSADAKPVTLAITTSDAGAQKFRTAAPSSIEGGLVKLVFKNAGQDPHEAQLVRIDGGHSAQEALKAFAAEDGPIPEWLHFSGGAGTTGPGRSVTTSLLLTPGSYAMLDNADFMGPPNSSRGAIATFEVTKGSDGELPDDSTAQITATENEQGTPDYGFEAEGLKVGPNRLRFENKGDELHHVVLFPIVADKTLKDVERALASDRPSGPPPVDFSKSASTAAIDGESAQVTDLVLRAPGRYALVCFISDPDGKGKPHFQRGMIKEVMVR